MPMCSSNGDREPRSALSALFRGLADPTRLAVLEQLTGGEARVADLATRLGLAQSTISGHVACLRECELITGRPEGRQIFYSLARPELLDLLDAAQAVLISTGLAVEDCPTYGTRRSVSGAAKPT